MLVKRLFTMGAVSASLFCTAVTLVVAQTTVEDSAQTLISQAPAGAQAYLLSPADGESVSSPLTVKFGLSGMGVAPAGVDKDKTGHHHLLIDVSELPDMTMPLPSTESIKHFGGGQTETEITLPSGTHTLQLVLGNYLHIPHSQPVVSDKITIVVE